MRSSRIDNSTYSINKCHYLSTEIAYALKSLAKLRTVADFNHVATKLLLNLHIKILNVPYSSAAA